MSKKLRIILQISVQLLLPIFLLAQKTTTFEIADSIVNVKALIIKEFGDEMIGQKEGMEGISSLGIINFDNLEKKNRN